VEGALDSGAVVRTEVADRLGYVGDVVFRNNDLRHAFDAVSKSGFGRPTVVEDYFDQLVEVVIPLEALTYNRRKNVQKLVKAVFETGLGIVGGEVVNSVLVEHIQLSCPA